MAGLRATSKEEEDDEEEEHWEHVFHLHSKSVPQPGMWHAMSLDWTGPRITLLLVVVELLLQASYVSGKGCSLSDAYKARSYDDSSFTYLWNHLATTIARLLTSDINTKELFEGKKFNDSADPISVIKGLQPTLAWATISLACVAGLLVALTPLVYALRSTGRCGGLRVQTVTLNYEHDIASFTLTIGYLVVLILVCFIFMVSACSGVSYGLSFIQEKAFDMRSDLKLFLDNMNCQFDSFLEGDIKPTLTNFRMAFSRGMESRFVVELSKKVREEMHRTNPSSHLYSIYGSTLTEDLEDSVAASEDDPDKANNAAMLKDSAMECDNQTAALWRELIQQFDVIQDSVRDTAVDKLNIVKQSEEKVENNILAKTNQAGDAILAHRGFFVGYGRGPKYTFEASKKFQTFVTLITSLIILGLDVMLFFSLALGTCTHDPCVVPTKRDEAAHYAGQAILCVAYASIPGCAALVYIAMGVMEYAVGGEAAICRPYNLGNPSWLDHLMTPPKSQQPSKVDAILEFITTPSNFQVCNKTFGSTLVSDVELLEKTESNYLRNVLLQNLSISGFSHSKAMLQRLYGAITKFNTTFNDVTAFVPLPQRVPVDYTKKQKIEVSKAVSDMAAKLRNKLQAASSTLDGVHDAIEGGYKTLVETKVNMLERSLAGIKDNIMSTIGDCGALQRIYNTGFSVLCNVIIRNMNGIWVALLAISAMLSYACYMAFKLSKFFLRMDKVTYEEAFEEAQFAEEEDRGDEEDEKILEEKVIIPARREISERDMSQLSRLSRMSRSTRKRLRRRKRRKQKRTDGYEQEGIEEEEPRSPEDAEERRAGARVRIEEPGKEESDILDEDQEKFNRMRRLSMTGRRRSVAEAGFNAFRRLSLKIVGTGGPGLPVFGPDAGSRRPSNAPPGVLLYLPQNLLDLQQQRRASEGQSPSDPGQPEEASVSKTPSSSDKVLRSRSPRSEPGSARDRSPARSTRVSPTERGSPRVLAEAARRFSKRDDYGDYGRAGSFIERSLDRVPDPEFRG